MIKVVTREEVMENIKNRIIENLNKSLMLNGQAGYTIDSCDCADRDIAIKLGREIARLYREEKYNVDTYVYSTSSRSGYINITVNL